MIIDKRTRRRKNSILQYWQQSRTANSVCTEYKRDITATRLTGTPRRIYDFLAQHGAHEGYIRVNQAALAEVLDVSLTTVNQALINMVCNDVLDFFPNGRGYVYKIVNADYEDDTAYLADIFRTNGAIAPVEISFGG